MQVSGTGDWTQDKIDWKVSNNEKFHTALLSASKIGPYTKSLGIYKCPADSYLTSQQRGRGWSGRARSISMNGFIEGGAYNDLSGGNIDYHDYYRYDKFSDVVKPGPSDVWMLVDERPDRINNGWMITRVITRGQWRELPASYHNGACGFNFVDGQSEIHAWKEPSTKQPAKLIDLGKLPGPNSRDIDWMIKHSTALR